MGRYKKATKKDIIVNITIVSLALFYFMGGVSMAPVRVKILNEIFSHFQQMTQWDVTSPGYTVEYAAKAEALIELLEVHDCGSVGGFDKKNPRVHKSSFKLYDRFLTLVKKYNNEKDIKKDCGFTLYSMGQYFDMVSELRDKILGGEVVV